MLYGARVVIGTLLIMLFSVCAGGNAWIAARYLATRRKQGSMIPLVGGFSGCIGVLLLQWGCNWYAILPLFLDIGTFPNVISAVFYANRKRRQ